MKSRIEFMPLSAKILYTTIFLCCIGLGDMLDTLLFEKFDKNKSYSFVPGSSEESIMEFLKTGDVIVTNRPFLSCNPLTVLRTSLRQFITDSNYDHLGVIVCNQYEDVLPYVVEINDLRS